MIWIEQPLTEHPILSQFNRVVVLTGFNFPEVGELNYFTFKILFKIKETGEIFKEIKAPLIEIKKTEETNINDILKSSISYFLKTEIDNLV